MEFDQDKYDIKDFPHLLPKKNSYETPIGKMRVCTMCKLLLKGGGFRLREMGRLNGKCRRCQKKHNKVMYARRGDYHRERAREGRREYHAKDPLRDLRHHLYKSYGLSLHDFNKMLENQGYRCAICLTDKPCGPGKRFHVDHNHANKRVRGLLCSKCNLSLGLLGEDTQRIERMLDYLKSDGLLQNKSQN